MARARSGFCEGTRGPERALSFLAFSLTAGIAVYCTLSLLFGPAGLSAYRRLEARKAAMETNLAELGSIRERLNAELESLKSDPDRAAREARSLGYLRKGETAIILGERRERIEDIDSGAVLPYAQAPALSDLAMKEISLGACLAFMALLLAPRAAARRPRSAGSRRDGQR